MLITIVHSFMFVHHIYVCFVLLTLKFGENLDRNLQISKDYPYGFLTMWNFFLQAGYLGLVLALDLRRVKKLRMPSRVSQFLVKVRGYLLTGILGPFSIFVPTVFWFVYFVNRELIYPTIIDTVVPYYVNLAVHGTIIFVVAFEILIGQEFIPIKRYSLTLLWIYQLTYLMVLVGINHIHNVWVYGYLHAIGAFYRNLFFIGALLSTNIFYFLCYNLQLHYKKLNIIDYNHNNGIQKYNKNHSTNKMSKINKFNNLKKRC